MSDIFMSYASKDRERILPFVRELEKTGWSIFWDRTIPIGKTWRQVLNEELEKFECMIVVWSVNSVKSDWVCDEADEGKRREVLFPVFMDDVRPPIEFRSIQAANLVGWNSNKQSSEFEMLLEGLSSVLGRPPAQKKYPATEKKFITQSHKHFKSLNKRTKWNFRSEPQHSLSKEAVKKMLRKYDFYCSKHAFTEEYCNPQGNGIANEFRVKKDGLIVVDEVTGLIWAQSESSEYMTYADAQGYIEELNQKNFAGYNSWRLPTLPEAMSLLANELFYHGQYKFEHQPIIKTLKGDENYVSLSNRISRHIAPEFGFKKDRIWTSDRFSRTDVWDVNFVDGYCYWLDVDLEAAVIAVCKNPGAYSGPP